MIQKNWARNNRSNYRIKNTIADRKDWTWGNNVWFFEVFKNENIDIQK